MASFLSAVNINYLQYKLRAILPENKWQDIQMSVRDKAINWYKMQPTLDIAYRQGGVGALNKAFLNYMIAVPQYQRQSCIPIEQMFDNTIDPNVDRSQSLYTDIYLGDNDLYERRNVNRDIAQLDIGGIPVDRVYDLEEMSELKHLVYRAKSKQRYVGSPSAINSKCIVNSDGNLQTNRIELTEFACDDEYIVQKRPRKKFRTTELLGCAMRS